MDDKIIVKREVFKDFLAIFKTITQGATYKGKNRNDEHVYELRFEDDADAFDMMKSLTNQLGDFLDKQKTPSVEEKPKPEYMEKVFKLVNENPIPGVESIEVNESQRRFEVKYKYNDPLVSVDLASESDAIMKLYTFEDIKEAWYKFQEHGDGPWGGNFPDFLYGYQIRG